jgi:ABC-type glutathione transport system ATPase component
MRGKAGTGKSTISRTIASSLSKKGVLGGSFFLKRNEAERGNAKRLFPTLAKQLANSHVSSRMEAGILKALRDIPDISEKNLGDQFENLILQPLLAINDGAAVTVIIVIDALDECDQAKDIQTILNLFSQVKGSSALQLRLFFDKPG